MDLEDRLAGLQTQIILGSINTLTCIKFIGALIALVVTLASDIVFLKMPKGRGPRETALLKGRNTRTVIKASERSRYWNDPAVRLAKCAAERTRYRRGHRTTTTTQRYVNIKKLCMHTA